MAKGTAAARSRAPFDDRATYRVFLKRVPGGGRVVILVECEPEGNSGDATYAVSSASRAKTVEAWEVSSPGLVTSSRVNRAQMGAWGFAGTISGYGANAYFREGGNLRKYVSDFGKLAPQKSLLSRLFHWIVG